MNNKYLDYPYRERADIEEKQILKPKYYSHDIEIYLRKTHDGKVVSKEERNTFKTRYRIDMSSGHFLKISDFYVVVTEMKAQMTKDGREVFNSVNTIYESQDIDLPKGIVEMDIRTDDGVARIIRGVYTMYMRDEAKREEYLVGFASEIMAIKLNMWHKQGKI